MTNDVAVRHHGTNWLAATGFRTSGRDQGMTWPVATNGPQRPGKSRVVAVAHERWSNRLGSVGGEGGFTRRAQHRLHKRNRGLLIPALFRDRQPPCHSRRWNRDHRCGARDAKARDRDRRFGVVAAVHGSREIDTVWQGDISIPRIVLCRRRCAVLVAELKVEVAAQRSFTCGR